MIDNGSSPQTAPATEIGERPFLTAKDVADKLQVSRLTVYRWVKEGYLKAFKIGSVMRFDPDEVDKWVAANTLMHRAFDRAEKAGAAVKVNDASS